jgi:DNA repair protein RecN (Recombination protein N)
MIRELEICDFVLVDQLLLTFAPGFGALTGETGAGKSILLDALTFVLGARADAGWVRQGCRRAEVAVRFDWPRHPEAQALLAQWAIEPEEELVIRRVVDESGRSRGWIQGVAVTQAQLKALGGWLADIHGQHAHHALLHPTTQRRLLDRFAEAEREAEAVASLFAQWQEAQANLASAVVAQVEQAKERERLQWWLAEWEPLAFTAENWHQWQADHRRLAHAVELKTQLTAAHAALAADETGGLDQIAAAIRAVEEMVVFQPALTEALTLLTSAQTEVAEAAAQIRREAARCDEDPEQLAWLEERMRAIHDLARKHRVDPEALPALAASWQARLAQLEGSELTELQQSAEKAEANYRTAAALLSARRRLAAERLGTAIAPLLPELAMPHATFEVALTPCDPSPQGVERVAFLFSANPGQPLAPLAQVASGGELSRVGLAIQVAASRAEEIETLVFDEVDVGVSGAVAAVVGRLLQEVGSYRQVLAVTHQPQVAAAADWQWRVVKEVTEAGVRTTVQPLAEAERVIELARMIAGEGVSETALAHAARLRAEGRRRS